MKSYVLWSSAALLLAVTGCSNGTPAADHKPTTASVTTTSGTTSDATIQVTDFSKRTLAFQDVLNISLRSAMAIWISYMLWAGQPLADPTRMDLPSYLLLKTFNK